MSFKYVDRGAEDTMIFIPGWATDYRIFESVNIPFNYIFPTELSLENFKDNLLNVLKDKHIKKCSLFGWSLGGFLASEFTAYYPEFVDKLVLVSIRDRYNAEQINKIKNYLKENKKVYLYSFYNSSFFRKENFSWFKKTLFKDYCKLFSLDYLTYTLDYLTQSRIDIEKLKNIPDITIVHGEHDNIAPIEEALKIKEKLPQAKFVKIDKIGHLPFLEKKFAEKI